MGIPPAPATARAITLSMTSAAMISIAARPVSGILGPYIALFALVPLIHVLMTEKKLWRGALAGWLSWLGVGMVAFEGVAPAEFWAYPVLVAISGVPMAAAGAASVFTRNRLGRTAALALFPFLVVAAEFIPAQRALFGDFASGMQSLGYLQFGSPLMSAAAWSGVSGVTLLAVALNTAFYCAFTRRRLAPLAVAAAIAVVTFVPVPGSNGAADGVSPLRVAIIQGAVPSVDTLMARFDRSAAERMLAPYADMTKQAAVRGADLVVWGETVLPHAVRPGHVPDYVADALGTTTTALVGGVAVDGRRSYNSVFHWADAQLTEVYRKRALVPFNEAHYTPGQVLPPLGVNGMALGLGVCLDSVFGTLARESVRQGAQALVYVTEDGFAGRTVTPALHLRVTAFRAVETGRFVVFANQSGPSAVIDNHGRLTSHIAHGDTNGVISSVPAYAGVTPYVRFGDTFGLLSTVLALAGLTSSLVRRLSSAPSAGKQMLTPSSARPGSAS